MRHSLHQCCSAHPVPHTTLSATQPATPPESNAAFLPKLQADLGLQQQTHDKQQRQPPSGTLPNAGVSI